MPADWQGSARNRNLLSPRLQYLSQEFDQVALIFLNLIRVKVLKVIAAGVVRILDP